MSEMVERVARALVRSIWGDESKQPPQSQVMDWAVAAIEAMREPTEEMGAAGLLADTHDPIGEAPKLSDEQAEKIGWTDHLRANPLRWKMPVWRAMIDEALKP